MQKRSLHISIFLFILVLAGCSNKVEKQMNVEEQNLNDSQEIADTAEEKEVMDEALAYLHAVQEKDFSKVYGMLSSIYKDAGISEEDIYGDFEKSTVPFSDYDVSIMSVRDRYPDETSATNIDEPFFLVSYFFKSKGESREDYQSFDESDVKWIEDKVWFHKEEDEWKFYATTKQEGATWKPDVYAAALQYIEALKSQNPERIFHLLSNFYSEYGETTETIQQTLANDNGRIVSYQIKEVTDDLDLYSRYSSEIEKNIVRVNVRYVKHDVEGNAGMPSTSNMSWFFHNENGEWKMLSQNEDNLSEIVFSCYLEKNCDQYINGDDSKENESQAEGSLINENETSLYDSSIEPLQENDFLFKGISVQMSIDEALSQLAEPYDNLGEGRVNVYAFDGFSLTQEEDSDSFSISIIDETLATDRGVVIGDSFNKVKALYGTNYQDEGKEDDYRNIKYKDDQLGSEIVFTISMDESVSQITFMKIK